MKTRLTAAAATLVATAVIAACGGSKQGAQLPASQANQLISLLSEAKRRAETNIPGACHDIQNQDLPQLKSQLSSLPGNLDSNVRSTLENGIAHLNDLVNSQCSTLDQQQTPTTPQKTQTTTTHTTPPPTPTTAPLTPTTPTTHAAPPPPHTSTTPPTTAPSGPGNGGVGSPSGNGHGNGHGDGNGGDSGAGGGRGQG